MGCMLAVMPIEASAAVPDKHEPATQSATLSPPAFRALLAASVAQALDRNAGLRSGEAEVQAVQAEVEALRSQASPRVQLGGKSRAQSLGGGEAPLEGVGQSLNIEVVTPLVDWGRLAYALDSQRQVVEAADAQRLLAQQALGYQVVVLQLELSRQQAIVRLSEQYQQWMGDKVTMLQAIVAADRGRAIELVQARARLLQATEALRAAQVRGQEALATLRRYAGAQVQLLPEQNHWPLASIEPQRLLSQMQDHPQLRQAQAQSRAERARAESIAASTRPSVDWVVGKSTFENARGLQQPWHSRLSLTWTAFDGGASRAAARGALSRALAAAEQGDEHYQQLTHQVSQADQQVRAALERAALYRELARESGSIRQAFFEQWYHLGQRTLLDVLSADSDHYSHRLNELSSRFDGYLAIMYGVSSAGALLPWLRDGLEGPPAGASRLPDL